MIPLLLKIVAEKYGSDFPDLLQTAYHLCSQYNMYLSYFDKAPK